MASVRKVSNLTKVITSLESGLGSVSLPSLKSIHLQTRERNSSPGLRAFKKQVLPRLAFSNPGLKVQVDYLKSPPTKTRRAKMSHEDREKLSHDGEKGAESLQADFFNMPSRTIPVTSKSVSQIAKELLDLSHQSQDLSSSSSNST